MVKAVTAYDIFIIISLYEYRQGHRNVASRSGAEMGERACHHKKRKAENFNMSYLGK